MMTQIDLKEYLEVNDCYVYEEKFKDDGVYYHMRKHGGKTIAVVFPPKRGTYNKFNICHVCNLLGVEVPTCARQAQDGLDRARRFDKNSEGNQSL